MSIDNPTPKELNRFVLAEALRLMPYQDSLGKWTIGIGHLIDGEQDDLEWRDGITIARAGELLKADIAAKVADLRRLFPDFLQLGSLTINRRWAAVELCFQIGAGGIMGFRKAIKAAKAGDWAGCAANILDSKLARQTPSRAKRIAAEIKAG